MSLLKNSEVRVGNVDYSVAPEGYLLNVSCYILGEGDDTDRYVEFKNCALGKDTLVPGSVRSLSDLKAMEANGKASNGEILLESSSVRWAFKYKSISKNHSLVKAGYEFAKALKIKGGTKLKDEVYQAIINKAGRDTLWLTIGMDAFKEVKIPELSKALHNEKGTLDYATANFIQAINDKWGDFEGAAVHFYGDEVRMLKLSLRYADKHGIKLVNGSPSSNNKGKYTLVTGVSRLMYNGKQEGLRVSLIIESPKDKKLFVNCDTRNSSLINPVKCSVVLKDLNLREENGLLVTEDEKKSVTVETLKEYNAILNKAKQEVDRLNSM